MGASKGWVMTDSTESQPDEAPRKRGDAAWKSERDGIAARNDAARKAGMRERQDNERRADATRRKADARERAQMGLNEGGGSASRDGA